MGHSVFKIKASNKEIIVPSSARLLSLNLYKKIRNIPLFSEICFILSCILVRRKMQSKFDHYFQICQRPQNKLVRKLKDLPDSKYCFLLLFLLLLLLFLLLFYSYFMVFYLISFLLGRLSILLVGHQKPFLEDCVY